MKDKPSEWISISDLMAGVMAVVMLLLVMSVLQKSYSELKRKQEMAQGGAAQQKRIAQMLYDMRLSIDKQGVTNLILFDAKNGKITLKDDVFEKGSACITPRAAQAFQNIGQKVIIFLKNNPNVNIFSRTKGQLKQLPRKEKAEN